MQSLFVNGIKPQVGNNRLQLVNNKSRFVVNTQRMVAAHGYGSIKFSQELAEGRL